MPTEVAKDPMFIKISHSSGAHATVSLTGATVTSFVDSVGKEVLFVSSIAKLDGSKAIRGGIPLCFPQFGQPDKSMPQHGFMRANRWKMGKSYEEDKCSVCEFELVLTDDMRDRGGKWAPGGEYDCVSVFTVKVFAQKLITSLKVTNTGKVPIDFHQVLFHTYYKIPGGNALDKEICKVFGLKGYSVHDKVPREGSPEKFVQVDDYVNIDCEVDRIYSNPDKQDLFLTVNTSEVSSVQLTASGTVGGKKMPTSVVVWNPHIKKAKSLSDFGDEQYHDMICVEPGLLSNDPLQPEESMIFTQDLDSMRLAC